MKVGDRVKRVRRGCRPCYGTVEEVTMLESDANEQWLLVNWDHSGRSHVLASAVQRVLIDRSWLARQKRQDGGAS